MKVVEEKERIIKKYDEEMKRKVMERIKKIGVEVMKGK